MNKLIIKNAVARALEQSPIAWKIVQQIRFRNSKFIGQIVTPSHHIALEGFPRSGNSFALRSFLYANGARRSWAIATHSHRHAQVQLAARWNVPTAVFFRKPNEAVPSIVALFIQQNRIAHDAYESQEAFLFSMYRYYCEYHETVLKLSDDVVLSEFNVTTNHFGKVITALNDKYGCDFETPTDYAKMREEIFATGGIHLSPNDERDRIKKRLRDMAAGRRFEQIRRRAGEAYERLLPVTLADA